MTSFDDDDIISVRSRRRCVKGRVSYLESDNLGPALSEEIDLNEEHSNNLEIPADPDCNETLETEEYDGEPVTIDLSEFLSETALLAEALAENPSESTAAVSDCHSQFRVTSSKTDPPLCPVSDLPSLKELNLNEKNVPSEGSSCTLPVNPSSAVRDVLTSSSTKSSDPGEENIPLERNTLSPTVPLEVSISKTPMGESNACKTVGEATVAKDVLENTAIEALGKFPIVRCEKLNMENFVKKNAIKVGNWPLPKVSNTPKTKLNASKNSSVKKPRSVNPKTPKLFNKPITFNKLVPKNSIGASTNMVRSILVNPFELKPPGVTYSIGNSNVHRFVSSHTPVRTCLNEYSVGGKSIIKVVSKNVMSEHNSFTQMKKFPIITSVNKIGGPSKTLKIISPKKISPAVAEHKNVGVTPILPKPVIETITSPVLLNETSYTVIEPYVDDPTSPVRPKPILTVPLEVLPAIEDAESNELTHNGNELTLASKVSSKHLKSSRSVFLNGAIKQTSILSRHKKEPIPRGKSILTENNLVKVDTVLQNTSDSDIEESMSINKAKTAVVDAMTSVFSKPSKKQIKSKQNNKDSQNLSAHVADSSMFGCQSYNNSLNDILFGFGSVELMDENLSNEDVSSELSSPSFPKKMNKGPDVTLETRRKIVIKNKNQKTPSIISSYPEHIFDDDCADSDTLSASECGDDSDKSVLKTSETKKQKKHFKALKKTVKRGKRLSHNLEPDQNEEYTLCKTPDLSTKKSQKENSIPQLSDNELEYNGSKNVSANITKEANIEKPSSKDMKGIDTVSLRKNTKETRVSSRGKRKPSNDNVNNIIKQEPNEEPSEVNSKKTVKTGKGSLHFIHSRFKRNAKAKQSIKVAKRVRKQLSRPSDIIQEIKTITSGNSMVQKGKKISKENILNTSDSVVINPLSKSSVKHRKKTVKSIRPKSKKKIKTLKVLFKRSKQKQNSDNESQSSSLKEEISKSGSPCKENIPDLPCEKVSENPNSSVSCEEITIPSKLPEEICPDKLKESEVMVSNLSNQSNHEIQNSEIKAMQDIKESGKLEPIAPEESTDPNNSLRSLDGDASSSLREELCSARVEEPTELVSGVSGQNNPEIVNSECEVENNKDKSGSTINHSVYENKSDPKDGLRSEDFSVKSISGEEICSNCIEEPELPISNDSSCSNLELFNSETKSMKDSNLVNAGSGDADLTVSGENTVPNSGSSLPLDTDMDLTLRKESLENPKSPVSSKLDLTLELKNSDEKGIDNKCHKISLTVPESIDPNNGLKFPLDACTSVDGNTDTNIISNNSLVEPNGVSVILNESKDDDSSDHREEEQGLVKSKVMRKRKKKRKSCPKLKISKTMPDPESAGVKNWYVSERKASTDSAEFEQNSSKSSVNQNSKVLPEMPEVLQTKNTSDSHLELSSLNSEVLKPRTKISIDNSLKSAPVNDNISSEAVTDSNLEAVPTLEPPLHGNPSISNESSLLSLTSENKSEMHSSNSVISACDKSSNSNSIEVEKTEPDHSVKVFPPNSPKNSKEKKKAIIENHVVEELTSPETSKTEPLDLDKSTDPHFDQNIVDAVKEDQNIAQDKELDSTPLSTVRRRGRPKKNPPKSMETKAKKSQPVSGCGTAEIILSKGKRRRSKITSYFTPQASKSVELMPKPMESVPVPVEITSVPEVVTPKGATLPVETSVASALETMPSGSTRPPATSLKVACADTTCSEKIFPDATCVEDTPLNGRPTPLDIASEELTAAPPPKATTPQDATCVEESQSNANSIPKSPVEETSMDDAPAEASAAPALALAPKDATCKEKAPDANSSTESPMEETSVNVAPAKTPVALAQSTSRPSATTSNTPSNRGRKRKFCPEAVQVPFSMGWMREMVHRANEGHKVGQKVSDIYYFSPEGIKLRSMVEIGNYLSKHSECTLTLDHFTFARELVFHEPLEIERSAKQASSLPKFYKTKILDRSREMDAAMQKSPMKKFAPPLPSIPKLTIKNVNQGQVKKFTCVLGESSSNTKKSEGEVGLRKNSQACLESNNAPSAKKARISSEKQLNSVKDSLKVKSHSQSLTSGNSGRTFDVSSKKDKPDIAQIRSTFKQKLSESKTANSTAVQSRAKLKSKSLLPKKVETFHRPCSYHCAVARYQIPSVRCALCLCLFHPHCVPSITKGIGYACKSCVSAKLALYETIRNPKTASEDSNEEDQDMPFDIDASILYPVMQLKVLKKELKIFSSSFGNAANPGNLSICGIANPAPPMPVPYMPCLVTHLLRPPSPLRGPKQIAPKSISPMLPAQQLHQKGGNSVLPDRISANAPASNCRPILVRCSPSGRTVIHNGLVVNAPLNTNPLNALKNLTHDISHSGKWSAVSSSPLNSNFGTQSFSLKKNSASSDLNELPPKFQNTSVPSRVKDSILAASLSGRIPEDSNITQVNQPTSDENGLLTNHDCLKPIFKMLDICDLLRVGQVCKSWNHLSTQSFLWEKISFSNLMVTSWIDCCFFLRKADTKSIDFQDIVHPDQEGPFKSLEDYISILNNVEEVIFDQIPSHLLQSVVLNLHQLRKLECHFVTDAVNEQEIWNSSCTFKLSSLQGLNRLTKLKINSGGGIILKCDPEYLMPFLPNLRHLTLTGFKFSSHINLECLSMHKELISLELGDCSDIEPEVYVLLESLTKLRCLRLENGGSLEDIGLVKCLQKMTRLEMLELMNFKIPNNFEEAFQQFQQLIHLNIWPDTTTEGSLINKNLLQAISHCKDLSYACWGIITEGEDAPDTLEIRNHENETEELNNEELFHKLVKLFPECRVEVKFVPRKSWKEFCSVRD